MTETPAVEAHGITKRFGAVVANDGVDIALRPGTVHAVVGENGAGKSTLMSVLFGLYHPDAGEIRRDGEPVRFRGPHDAIAAGLGMVHQHFRLFGSLTVAENVVYGAEPRRRGLVDTAAAERQVRELSERLGLDVDPRARVDQLPFGVRQRVEILKALYRGAQVLILDEPTAVLTPGEVTGLFKVVEKMATEGVAVALVTHKVHEVLAVSDEVTVLRGGVVSGRFVTTETSADEIVDAMIGRGLAPIQVERGEEERDVVLAVDGLGVADDAGEARVRDVTFDVREGEILGVAGVAGNGQRELVEAVVGLRKPLAGRVRLFGDDLTAASPRKRRAAGFAYVPEDRRTTGLAADMSVAENLALGHHRTPPVAHRGWLSPARMRDLAQSLVGAFSIRAPDVSAPVGTLSGGNAQRVVLARELHHETAVLVVEQPTQGVDIGASEDIHRRLLDARAEGRSMLLVSNELAELRALADRIVVMYEGRLVAEFSPDAATDADLGAAMTGGARS